MVLISDNIFDLKSFISILAHQKSIWTKWTLIFLFPNILGLRGKQTIHNYVYSGQTRVSEKGLKDHLISEKKTTVLIRPLCCQAFPLLLKEGQMCAHIYMVPLIHPRVFCVELLLLRNAEWDHSSLLRKPACRVALSFYTSSFILFYHHLLLNPASF